MKEKPVIYALDDPAYALDDPAFALESEIVNWRMSLFYAESRLLSSIRTHVNERLRHLIETRFPCTEFSLMEIAPGWTPYEWIRQRKRQNK